MEDLGKVPQLVADNMRDSSVTDNGGMDDYAGISVVQLHALQNAVLPVGDILQQCKRRLRILCGGKHHAVVRMHNLTSLPLRQLSGVLRADSAGAEGF